MIINVTIYGPYQGVVRARVISGDSPLDYPPINGNVSWDSEAFHDGNSRGIPGGECITWTVGGRKCSAVISKLPKFDDSDTSPCCNAGLIHLHSGRTMCAICHSMIIRCKRCDSLSSVPESDLGTLTCSHCGSPVEWSTR